MPIAKEGLREILLATLVLGACAFGAGQLAWPVGIPFVIIWVWVLSFFRDPRRRKSFSSNELCAPADGTVTEIAELEHHDSIGGPAVRIGIFLSLFNVHVNRMPCSGRVRSIAYRKGSFLDARHPESGKRNEANTVLLDPDSPLPGPVEVRQIAGLVARRIICHASEGQQYGPGERFGLIKFGSRTELVFPRLQTTEITVGVGDRVRAGLTLMVRQPINADSGQEDSSGEPAFVGTV